MDPIPGISMAPGGGLSFADETRISFDPFADNRRTMSNSINVKTGAGITLESVVPVVMVALLAYLAYKLFFK